jgi:hypothetical protein
MLYSKKRTYDSIGRKRGLLIYRSIPTIGSYVKTYRPPYQILLTLSGFLPGYLGEKRSLLEEIMAVKQSPPGGRFPREIHVHVHGS